MHVCRTPSEFNYCSVVVVVTVVYVDRFDISPPLVDVLLLNRYLIFGQAC